MFRSQTFRVARSCARGKVDARDAGEADRNSASGDCPRRHWVRLRRTIGPLWGDGDPNCYSATSSPGQLDAREAGGPSSPYPVTVPIPPSPSLFVHAPSSPPFSVQLPPTGSSFDKFCMPPQAPQLFHVKYTDLTDDQLHDLCRQRGYSRGDPKAALKTRLATTVRADRKPSLVEGAVPYWVPRRPRRSCLALREALPRGLSSLGLSCR